MTQRTAANRAGPIISYIIVIAVNFAANAVPIGGQRTGDVSAKYASLFTPAGYTFSIWGVIYLALGCYVVYQALPAQQGNAVLARIGTMFNLSCLFNVAWLFTWHYELLAVALLLMIVLLLILVRIYRGFEIYENLRPDSERLFVHLPFSLYTAWICVAAIANASAMQTALVWNDIGMSAASWTLLKLSLAGCVGAAVILLRRDVIFGIVIVWASFGIANGQTGTAGVSGGATAIGALTGLLCLFELVREARSSLRRED